MSLQIPVALIGGTSVIGMIGLFYVGNYAIRKKELLVFKLKRSMVAMVLCAAGFFTIPKMGYPTSTVVLGSFSMGLCAVLIVRRPRDSRYISREVKRAIIERDLKNPEDYDPDKLHFDHIVPYSKGGNNSVRNLRLISKKKNLHRGAKNPRLRDFL